MLSRANLFLENKTEKWVGWYIDAITKEGDKQTYNINTGKFLKENGFIIAYVPFTFLGFMNS